MSRILVVDDDPEVQQTMAHMLNLGGHIVTLPLAGPGLLGEIDRLEFDLVITDMLMPHVDGWDVLRWIRTHRPQVPVMLVSGALGSRWSSNVSEFDAYTSKPVRKMALLDSVTRLLSSAHDETVLQPTASAVLTHAMDSGLHRDVRRSGRI